MATNPKKLNVTEFDFDTIKANLKIFLKNQTEFTDYNFEGSGMSALLDVLAYNTHYLGFNMNMLANEMFLDSAVLRSSVVSQAKTLGYEPSSARAAKATINISLNTTDATATMDAGTVFTSSIKDVTYQFVTLSDITGYNIGNSIPFKNVEIYEGTRVTTRYTVDSTNVDQKFTLSDNRADTTTLKVIIQTSSSDTTQVTYKKVTDITQVTENSTSYWLQEADNGKFEVYFGDGVVGKSLVDGNLVLLTYVVSNKELGNAGSSFTNAATISDVSDIDINTVNNSSGGAEPESIASIKANAPLDFAAQGRCVTTEDYKLYAKKLFANTQTVQVWGGENGSYDTSLGVIDTPVYGKVYISIKSTTGNNLTAVEKSDLVRALTRYKVASVTPVIVDPETTWLILTITFKFNSDVTTKTASELISDINLMLTSYNTNTLLQFGTMFRHSEISGKIDNEHTSILSNITNVAMAKYITPTISTSKAYNLYFNNNFYHPYSGYNADNGGVIASTGFYVSGDTVNVMYFDDDGEGNLRRYYISAGSKVYEDETAGTVEYKFESGESAAGKIVINAINIISVANVDGASSTKFRIVAIPDSKDIVPVRNQILEIDFVNSTVTGEVDTIAIGESGASASYVTNTSHGSNTAY
tara:strand:+ start:12387 stop:14312 length:1926 start_codon:yes stop_codon:yes gene_type:complete